MTRTIPTHQREKSALSNGRYGVDNSILVVIVNTLLRAPKCCTQSQFQPVTRTTPGGVVDIDVTKYLGKAQKLNITLPGYLLNRIDEYVLHHPEEKSRSGFLASAALKVLQQDR